MAIISFAKTSTLQTKSGKDKQNNIVLPGESYWYVKVTEQMSGIFYFLCIQLVFTKKFFLFAQTR
jgi:hypothetical protein